jgi:hypothetical protein
MRSRSVYESSINRCSRVSNSGERYWNNANSCHADVDSYKSSEGYRLNSSDSALSNDAGCAISRTADLVRC